jgi:hypothetical protein
MNKKMPLVCQKGFAVFFNFSVIVLAVVCICDAQLVLNKTILD